ncbi:type II toxin-antitoxin system RelE/ParE family toxin [Candidatus Poribacteria bacterium]|nr:type II toxin-antitoxin system RelE/ParE family toxin [Candidatus Poribacteria bacterium]
MIQSFKCSKTADLFHRNRIAPQWRQIVSVALRKLNYLHAASQLADLRVPPGNRLEKLCGDRKGQYSIRINRQWRICFEFLSIFKEKQTTASFCHPERSEGSLLSTGVRFFASLPSNAVKGSE